VGVAVLAGLLLTRARAHPASYLLDATGTDGARVSALGFTRSLVLGVWTFTGFDAAAHVSEETRDPARRAPAGIVSAVAVSAVAGFVLVASLTLAVRDPSAVAGAPDAALAVLRGALGEDAGRAAMALVALAMWFAGLSSVTSASRMLFAFARDGGVPWAARLRRVNPRTGTPVVATAVASIASLVLVAVTAPLSTAVFLAVAALATVALYASYAVPIALGAIARTRGRWVRRGAWNFGRAGAPIAWAAVAWAAGVAFVCTLANPLAMEIFVVLIALLGVLWIAAVRRRFEGPKVDLAHFEHVE
jgi:amino acid transporter